ncbi:hypothetical protein J6590_081327 [Homalodisca vitripennis]|nr:hypothetical protein J6590_081325 [Homalodisca vitripennis]KAG8280486.1 hypothetical protein J6590_081327 [Homalodisca vitripennis]
MPWTWYVAVDFQLHVLSPLLLLVIYKKRALGFFLAGIVLLASNSYAMAYFSWNGLSTGGMVKRNLPLESFTIQYTQTHFRLNTFIIGLCFGYLLDRIKQKEFKVKLSKTQLLTGWVVAAILFLGTLFSMTIFDDPEYVQTPWLDTTYHVWSRQSVPLAVIWVIFVCTIGSGGIIDKVLSWRALLPLSRLNYCAYLLHMVVLQVQIYRTRSSLTVDTLNIWHLFFADVFIVYILAAILYLGVEAPIGNVLNCLLKDSLKSTEKSQSAVPTIQNP